PDWIDSQTWEEFLKVRKKLRAVNTARALNELIKSLQERREAGENVEAIINQSIVNSWKDVFPLRDKLNGGRGDGGGERQRAEPKGFQSIRDWDRMQQNKQ